MPLIDDAINYIRGATIIPATANYLLFPVGDWLDEIPRSHTIEQALGQIPVGPGDAYKSRRAMILILCALNQVSVVQAKQVVGIYKDNELPAKLGTMVQDVARVALPRRLLPALHSLLNGPATFLANNRIRTGSGIMAGSGPTAFNMSWDFNSKLYMFEPPGAIPAMHIATPGGYNVGTTKFSTIGNLAQITGAVAQGAFAMTTQLSGCSILYSVNAGDLVVAHVWPDDGNAVKTNMPLPVSQAVGGSAVGVILAMRMVHEGGLSNPVNGGAFGIYGMVDSVNDVGLRSVGPGNVRMHGYAGANGNAYFLAVLVGGNWHLFGQQNNPGLPNAGVSISQQLYP